MTTELSQMKDNVVDALNAAVTDCPYDEALDWQTCDYHNWRDGLTELDGIIASIKAAESEAAVAGLVQHTNPNVCALLGHRTMEDVASTRVGV